MNVNTEMMEATRNKMTELRNIGKDKRWTELSGIVSIRHPYRIAISTSHSKQRDELNEPLHWSDQMVRRLPDSPEKAERRSEVQMAKMDYKRLHEVLEYIKDFDRGDIEELIEHIKGCEALGVKADVLLQWIDEKAAEYKSKRYEFQRHELLWDMAKNPLADHFEEVRQNLAKLLEFMEGETKAAEEAMDRLQKEITGGRR
jgi:hypothetical protein